MQELINWLQLSDFHCGQNDNDWMQRIRSEFCSQFTKIINDRGLPYPDLIFITGDLAYSGKSNEYDIFDKTMKDIKACLPGWNPTILSVPGNHDSDRDKLVLNKSNIDSFTNYLSNWCKRNCVCFKDCKERLNNICVANCRKRQFNIACSSYPGDYYWQFNLPGQFPFAIVGLNSELTENIGTSPNITFKRLEMLQKATHEKGLHPKNLDRKFLLMHHPPSNFRHQQQIFKDIDTLFGNIDICLHGHLHTSQSTIIRTVSGKTEYQYQGVSLCGLEHFGTLAENRSFGFSIGSISRYGEIRVWPFAREYVEGAYNFVWDRRLGEERHSDRTEGTLSGILIRKATRPKFDFYQLAKESNKITFIGLFHRSSLIADHAGNLINCLSEVSEGLSKLDVTFILPVRSTLKDYSALLKINQSTIENHWDMLIRNIRVFLSMHPKIKGKYQEHTDIYPIEAIVFDDQYIVHRILGFPADILLQSDWNDESFGQLIRAIEQVKANSSPIMEFNIYGQYVNNVFRYDGIVPQPIWRSFLPVGIKTFPVSICLIVNDGELVLQVRSQRNSGSDLERVSLVASKLIEADFLNPPRNEMETSFWADAEEAWKLEKPTEHSFRKVSEKFKQLVGLCNQEIPKETLELASKRAMKRGLYSELNMSVTENSLNQAPSGYTKLIEKDGFSILASLFWIEITNEEFNKCTLHDSDIQKVDVSWLDNNKNRLNGFIATNMEQIKQLIYMVNRNKE